MAVAETKTRNALQIRSVVGRIEAEVLGVRLSSDLADDEVAALEAALHARNGIFFRGPHHLDDASQEPFAERMGHPSPHPTVPVRDGSHNLLKLDFLRGGRTNRPEPAPAAIATE